MLNVFLAFLFKWLTYFLGGGGAQSSSSELKMSIISCTAVAAEINTFVIFERLKRNLSSFKISYNSKSHIPFSSPTILLCLALRVYVLNSIQDTRGVLLYRYQYS